MTIVKGMPLRSCYLYYERNYTCNMNVLNFLIVEPEFVTCDFMKRFFFNFKILSLSIQCYSNCIS